MGWNTRMGFALQQEPVQVAQAVQVKSARDLLMKIAFKLTAMTVKESLLRLPIFQQEVASSYFRLRTSLNSSEAKSLTPLKISKTFPSL